MRVLAVDFGERRIGLAISDDAGVLAVPLETLERRSDRQAVEAIAALAARETVREIVVGEPRNVDGSLGPAAERCRAFAARLAEHTGIAVTLCDETLTTVEAAERLRAAGIDPRREPRRLDAVAAQILLEEVLARRPHGDREAR
jgi:putative Holliday junction resolvase